MADTKITKRDRSRPLSSGALPKKDQFPAKLYEMLEAVEDLGLSHTVSWLPHGRAFQVIDPEQFVKLVVPKFFKATKYRSFTRQLNLWGFRRVAKGEEIASWHHEHFIRSCPESLSSITRTRVKKTVPHPTFKMREVSVTTPSDYSSDESSVYFEDSGPYSDSKLPLQVRHTSDYVHTSEPSLRREEPFNIFAENTPRQRTSSHSSVFVKMEKMRLEPLPIHSAGVLDSPDSNSMNGVDLNDFGQLLKGI